MCIGAIECLNTNEAPLSIIHVYRQYWWSSSISMVGVGNAKNHAKISLIGCGGDLSLMIRTLSQTKEIQEAGQSWQYTL